jgi:hypothetical protein
MIKYTKLRALAKAASSDGLLLDMLTVYERAEEGWPPTRLDLSSARVLDLLTRYLTLFAEAWVQPATLASPFARHGFECGPGWFQIIDRLAAKLVLDPNLRVGQMKEEVGLLTVCFEASELARRPSGQGSSFGPRRQCSNMSARPRSSGRPKVYLSATARPTALATIATNQRHGLYAVVGALEEEPNAGLEDGSKDE